MRTACEEASYSTSFQVTVLPGAMSRFNFTPCASPIGSACIEAEAAAVMSLPQTV